MRTIDRQYRIEDKTHQAINDLENELDIDLNKYPEVVWSGKFGYFEKLGLPESYRKEVEENRKSGGSIFLYKPNIIIINRDSPHHINEESSHCLHLNNARISLYGKSKEDWFSIRVMMEMIGFFGSKILDPSRKNGFHNYPDYFALVQKKDGGDFERAMLPFRYCTAFEVSEMIIHSQGYGLGERVFNAFETGDCNLDEVKKLIKTNFSKPKEAIRTLENLRKKYWPIAN